MKQDNEDVLQQAKNALTDAKTIAWLQEKTKDFGKLMTYYRCAMMEIETKFNVLNEEFSLEHDRNPINSIKTRLKSVPSIREKLERRNIALSLAAVEENLSDIAGVRVICSFVDDVYVLAHALLQQDDVELIEKKDYIASPKPNGYRSLHLIVGIPIFLKHEKRIMKVEIQLRTIAMDFWASLEHQLRYKKDFLFSNEMAKELQECAELSAVLDSRMDNLRKSVSGSDDKQQKNKKSV